MAELRPMPESFSDWLWNGGAADEDTRVGLLRAGWLAGYEQAKKEDAAIIAQGISLGKANA